MVTISLAPTSCVVGGAGQRRSEAGYPGGGNVVDPCRACDRRNSGAGAVPRKKISTLSTVRLRRVHAQAAAQRLIWLPRDVLDKLNRLRGAAESYSDGILRLAA